MSHCLMPVLQRSCTSRSDIVAVQNMHTLQLSLILLSILAASSFAITSEEANAPSLPAGVGIPGGGLPLENQPEEDYPPLPEDEVIWADDDTLAITEEIIPAEDNVFDYDFEDLMPTPADDTPVDPTLDIYDSVSPLSTESREGFVEKLNVEDQRVSAYSTQAAIKPFTYFAAVAYCTAAKTKTWNCGAKCNYNSKFKPVASGGNGVTVQYWYVGYDPTRATVVVAFQGTDPTKILPLVQDGRTAPKSLRAALFPGVSPSVRSHKGFGDAHAASAVNVLAAVKKTMSTYNAQRVTVVGHSLGGAIATLSALNLKLQLPSATTFRLITFGSPRVGNQAFVNLINSKFPGIVSRVVNQNDFVPILPGRFLGYHHVKGELHILSDLSWISCLGQDNTDSQCSIGYVPHLFSGDINHHNGPFDGVIMGCT